MLCTVGGVDRVFLGGPLRSAPRYFFNPSLGIVVFRNAGGVRDFFFSQVGWDFGWGGDYFLGKTGKRLLILRGGCVLRRVCVFFLQFSDSDCLCLRLYYDTPLAPRELYNPFVLRKLNLGLQVFLQVSCETTRSVEQLVQEKWKRQFGSCLGGGCLGFAKTLVQESSINVFIFIEGGLMNFCYPLCFTVFRQLPKRYAQTIGPIGFFLVSNPWPKGKQISGFFRGIFFPEECALATSPLQVGERCETEGGGVEPKVYIDSRCFSLMIEHVKFGLRVSNFAQR